MFEDEEMCRECLALARSAEAIPLPRLFLCPSPLGSSKDFREVGERGDFESLVGEVDVSAEFVAVCPSETGPFGDASGPEEVEGERSGSVALPSRVGLEDPPNILPSIPKPSREAEALRSLFPASLMGESWISRGAHKQFDVKGVEKDVCTARNQYVEWTRI